MKKNMIKPDVAESVQNFFQNYLVRERGLSSNTIRSYRDTFILLLDYYQSKVGISPDKLSFDDFSRARIGGFMDWLLEERKNTGSTRNQRFASIRSFCQYMIYIDPVHMSTWKEIMTIRYKKYDSQAIKHMTVEEVKCLLEQIDVSHRHGRRDLALLSLLYNGGLRVQELIDLMPKSIRLYKPYVVNVYGKGKKHRAIPLDEPIINLMDRYMTDYNLKQVDKTEVPLFANARGEKLTTAGVTHIINKYVTLAKQQHPEFYSIKITPHVFRHSRAMHLLQSGMNLVYIRDILGHSSVQTTEIYARAEPNHVRAALETAYERIGISEPQATSWERDPALKEFLKNLC